MNIHEKISRIADELYEKSGRVDGRDKENWHEAERIVKSRRQAPEKTASVAAAPAKAPVAAAPAKGPARGGPREAKAYLKGLHRNLFFRIPGLAEAEWHF